LPDLGFQQLHLDRIVAVAWPDNVNFTPINGKTRIEVREAGQLL